MVARIKGKYEDADVVKLKVCRKLTRHYDKRTKSHKISENYQLKEVNLPHVYNFK